jgi:hypothetical protein
MVEFLERIIKSDSCKIKPDSKRLKTDKQLQGIMPKSHCFFYILFVSLLVGFFSCEEDFEDFSTNPQDLLSFSVDTLSFDTVLTTVNSPFRTFMVYNRNSKPLLISSVRLAGGNESGFKINVDGFAGSSFENIEIGANDSIYVFVDVKPKANGEYIPTYFNDQIVFVTNDIQQQIVLTAYGQDIFRWRGVVLTSDSILSNQKPFLIYDSLVIDKGVTVEIKDGTTFYMHNNAELIVRGTLKVKGTVEKPVVFRGSRTDEIVGIPFDRIPGQWDGISFDSDSYENEFENVHIRNNKSGMDFEVSDPLRNKITMKNVILTNVSGTLINAINCKMIAENCEFSNAKNAILRLIGGSYHFTHCTIANFYPSQPEYGWLHSNNETLLLSNTYYPESPEGEIPNPQYFPLLEAVFSNTIIWGEKPVTSDIVIYKNPETAMSYTFINCIIPNEGFNDEDFIDCLFKSNPLFSDTEFIDSSFQTEEKNVIGTFDFSLQEKSPARNMANQDIAKTIPYDLKGFSRFADNQPDAGAYEYKTKVE